jgi:hypothetical protein
MNPLIITKNIPEKRLQVLRQLSSARVTGIHGDEYADCGNQWDHLPHEIENLLLFPDRILNRFHLHRYHGQHLDRDSVEFIKTAPSSSLGQPFVDIAARLKLGKQIIIVLFLKSENQTL